MKNQIILVFCLSLFTPTALSFAASCSSLQAEAAKAKQAFKECKKRAAEDKNALSSGRVCQAEEFNEFDTTKKLADCRGTKLK